MSELVLILLAGLALLALFVYFLLAGERQQAPADPIPVSSLTTLVSLPGLSFHQAERLFDATDYRTLRCGPVLAPLADELWRERRRLALLWLSLLQEDVRTLWRFRRLLSRYGATGSVAAELGLALMGLGTLASLTMLRVAVYVLGPFQVATFCRGAGRQVEAVSHSCASLLSRIPAWRLPEIESRWTDLVEQAHSPLTR